MTDAPHDLDSVPLRLDAPFVGRESELKTLVEAFDAQRDGYPRRITVVAGSGLGRSALLSRFHRVAEDAHADALVLSGACRRGRRDRARSYQALSAQLGRLAEWLARRPASEGRALLPRGIDDLAALFPAFRPFAGRSESSSAEGHAAGRDDPPLRRLGLRALRELLHRIAARVPVALLMDDAHWADSASLELLSELIDPPDAPPILYVPTVDPREPGLGESHGPPPQVDERRIGRLRLGPLSSRDADSLARLRLGIPGGRDDPRIEALVRAAGGSPRWICRLTDEILDADPAAELGVPTIPDYVATRLGNPDEPTGRLRRRIAGVLALGGPRPAAVIRGAALENESEEALDRALSHLMDEDLVRLGGADLETLSWVDEATRAAALSLLPPEKRPRLHLRLAWALGNGEAAELERIDHLTRGGRPEEAAEAAARAAEAALERGDDETAAELLELAVDHLQDGRRARALRLDLAEALDRLGADHDAADQYLRVIEELSEDDPTLRDLQRRAGDRLLAGGKIEQGLGRLAPLFERHGLGWLVAPDPPGTVRQAIQVLRLLWWRLFSRRRSEENVSAEQLEAVDLCFSLSRSVGVGWPAIWRTANREHLVQALRAGEPYRLSRALSLETAYSAHLGAPSSGKVLHLSHRALGLARQVGRPHAHGLAQTMVGEAWTLLGEWRRALSALERAERILEAECPQAWWERRSVFFLELRCLALIGRMGDLERSFEIALTSGRYRRSTFFLNALDSRFRWLIELVNHRPQTALDHLESAISRAEDPYFLPGYWQLYGWIETLIYSRRTEDAWRWLEGNWAAVIAPRIGQVALLDIEIWSLRARAGLARVQQAVCDHQTLEQMLAYAEEAAEQLDRLATPWATAAAITVRAALDGFLGNHVGAAVGLEKAGLRFEEADMELHAAACRFQKNRLTGNGSDEPQRHMERLGVVDPESWADLLVPGLWWKGNG